MNNNEALSKAMKLCSTREYAPFEMEQKLISWGISEKDAQALVETLKNEKFLDEHRMAGYFVNDKLRFNKWGKVKIKYMLQQKHLSKDAITEALDQINEDEYLTILTGELTKKRKTIKDSDEYRIRTKLMQFASGRGFEPDVVYKIVDKFL